MSESVKKKKSPSGRDRASILKAEERRLVLNNTVKGTIYENVNITDFAIKSVRKEAIANTGEQADMISDGRITFLFDDDKYLIRIEQGYFQLYVVNNGEAYEASPHYIMNRCYLKDNIYYPAETGPTYEERENIKKKPTTYMTKTSGKVR